MAPILLKDFQWSQSSTHITIIIPFNSKGNDVDLFTHSSYIKVHSPPYLFELFLSQEIDEDNSKCTCGTDSLVLELPKKEPVHWDKLEETLDKEQKITKRTQILNRKHEESEKKAKIKKEKLSQLKRLSVQQQIDLDGSNRQLINSLKQFEKEKFTQEIELWKEQKNSHDLPEVRKPILDDQDLQELSDNIEVVSIANSPQVVTKSRDETLQTSSSKSYKCKTADYFPIPLPRAKGLIQVKFTTREFPTPSRESLHEEEQVWLKKQLAARRAAGFVAEDLRPEECNPVWLKEKGDSFHTHGNYLGAVSAYSHAIKIGSKMPSLFSNRSASHLALGNLHKALEDSSEALELLTPCVPRNLEQRATCHARRATILCQLGLPEKALSDYQEAMKLRPDDQSLQADYVQAQAMAEENEDSSDD